MDIVTELEAISRLIARPYLLADQRVLAGIRHEQRRHPKAFRSERTRRDLGRMTAHDLEQCDFGGMR